MGMVVSAAVTGIPIVEQLETARPLHGSKKPTGGKTVHKKGGSISTANQKQPKGKQKGTQPVGGKGATPKEGKTAISKSSSTSKSNERGPVGTAQGNSKGAPDKKDTENPVGKGVGRGGKGPLVAPSTGDVKGRGKGKR